MITGRRITSVMLVVLVLAISHPRIDATARAAGTWEVTSIADTAAGPLSSLGAPYINDSDEIVFRGSQADSSGVYHYRAGVTTQVLQEGAVLNDIFDISTGQPVDLGTVSGINAYNIGDQGRVFLDLQTQAGRAFVRWQEGSFTRLRNPDPGFSYNLSSNTFSPDGTWLMRKVESVPQQTERWIIYATNGVTSTLLLDLSLDKNGFDCSVESINSWNLWRDRLVYKIAHHSSASTAFGPCTGSETVHYELISKGAAANDSIMLATEQEETTIVLTDGGLTIVGEAGASLGQYKLNANGDLIYRRYAYGPEPGDNDDSIDLVLMPGNTLILTEPYRDRSFEELVGLGDQRRAVARFSDANTSLTSLVTIDSAGGREVMLDQGAALFGHVGWGLDIFNTRANQQLSTVFTYWYEQASEDGPVTQYGIALLPQDGTCSALSSVALLTTSESCQARWIDPQGGDWGNALNWSSARVPSGADKALFDLEGAYQVTTGKRQLAEVAVNNGNVVFNQNDLNLSSSLTLSGDANLWMADGRLTSSEIFVGVHAPENPAQPLLARLNILGPSTTAVTTTETLFVGYLGAGELEIDNARVHNTATIIGFNNRGTLTVKGRHALVETGDLIVGNGYTATLNIERDAKVDSRGVAIGLGFQGELDHRWARINIGANSDSDGATWSIRETLRIGGNSPAELTISEGASVDAFDNVWVGFKAHPVSFLGWNDASIRIEGTGRVNNTPSSLEAYRNLELGLGRDTKVNMVVLHGGKLEVRQNLSLGAVPFSDARLAVDGFSPSGARATAKAQGCIIGAEGRGRLDVYDGGVVECGSLYVGMSEGSMGLVQLTGEERGVGSTLLVHGLLCVGGSYLCLTDTANTRGELRIGPSGVVMAENGVLVGNGGELGGKGVLSLGNTKILVENGGRLDPGVQLEQSPQMLKQASPAAAQPLLLPEPGTLTIEGGLTLSPTASLIIDLIGRASGQYDQLVITGTAMLDGRLELRFGNGFAPRQGDSFSLVQSGSSSGAFNQVVLTGLAPGFDYRIDAADGSITLTALNDGVPATLPERAIYLPLLRG